MNKCPRRAGSNLWYLTGNKPAQLTVMTSWTHHGDQEVTKCFGRPRVIGLCSARLKEGYLFSLLSLPTHKKTISTKKPCRKPALGEKSKHELKPVGPRSISSKVPMQKRCIQPRHKDTHRHSQLPSKLWWVVGYAVYPVFFPFTL